MRHGSQISRGDLLRWLQENPTPTVQQLTAPCLGFGLPEQKLQQLRGVQGLLPQETDNEDKKPEPPIDSKPLSGKAAPELFYALQSRQQYATPESLDNDLPEKLQDIQPLRDDELQPFAAGDPIPWQPILPAPRLANFLRKTLAYSTGRRLDMPKLIKQVSDLKLLTQLPSKPRTLPAGRVVVLVDLSKRLRPFWQDMVQLCQLIERKHGRNGLDIRMVEDNPWDDYWDWFDPDRRLQPWQPLHAQSVVFIMSDLRQLRDADNKIENKTEDKTQDKEAITEDIVRRQWLYLMQQCQRLGIKPIILAPISAAQQHEDLQTAARQILWHKHSRLVPQRKAVDLTAHHQMVQRVLGLISIAAHVEPELLRAILSCLPATQADSGIEAAVWLHEDVIWGYTAITIKPVKRAGYQALFKQEPSELQQQVLSLLKAHHIGQFPAVWAEEVLNAQALVNFDLNKIADVAQAEQFMLGLTRRCHDQQGHSGLNQFARRHLQRLGADSKQQYRDYTSALFGLAYKAELREGTEIPPEYDAAIVQKVSGEKMIPQRFYLQQLGENLFVKETYRINQDLTMGVELGEFTAGLDVLTVSTGAEKYIKPIALNRNRAEALLSIPLTGEDFTIDTGLEKLQITAISKPSWAHQIKQSVGGLKANLFFAGRFFTLHYYTFVKELHVESKIDPLMEKGINWQSEYHDSNFVGVDQYGLYADLILDSARQRFRWLEPGTFLMGSPETELDREWIGMEKGKGSETQHQVTLSQGFWLADTAVSQAFWLAAMGDNPSEFKDNPENPVENVSWQDTQLFIDKLNHLFPGLSAQLPTEAQWEYACRAGTSTPFSFGMNISPEQVNYDGKYPYAGGQKGVYRERTVPVKSLPANPWGLYEMHGNVYEWCADVWQQQLSDEPVTDPLATSPDINFSRVLRGGSWNAEGWDVRSADRFSDSPDGRDGRVGFRLALGHIEPSAIQVQGFQAQGEATGVESGRRVAEQRQTESAPVAEVKAKAKKRPVQQKPIKVTIKKKK